MSYSSRFHRPSPSNINSASFTYSKFFKLRNLLNPKMLVIIALLFCWNLRNSFAVALYHPGDITSRGLSSQNEIPFYHNSPQHHHHNSHHRTITSNVRLRAPPSLNQLPPSLQSDSLPLGGAGITLSDETAIVGPLTLGSLPSSQQSTALIPMDVEFSGVRRKKDCGEPSIATRGLLGPTLKRSYFAFTQDEVNQKVRDDQYRAVSERRKRDIQHQQLVTKRNGGGGAMESADSPLPWTCETQYEWEDMGADHYPRFVRTAKCKTKLCFNGFFRCRPRRYKTKVLKRISPGDSTSCEDDDVSLPETLRNQWKFITVTINLCCDCTGRMPGTTEV